MHPDSYSFFLFFFLSFFFVVVVAGVGCCKYNNTVMCGKRSTPAAASVALGNLLLLCGAVYY